MSSKYRVKLRSVLLVHCDAEALLSKDNTVKISFVKEGTNSKKGQDFQKEYQFDVCSTCSGPDISNNDAICNQVNFLTSTYFYNWVNIFRLEYFQIW